MGFMSKKKRNRERSCQSIPPHNLSQPDSDKSVFTEGLPVNTGQRLSNSNSNRWNTRVFVLIPLQICLGVVLYSWGVSSGSSTVLNDTSELDRILALSDSELERVPIARINLLVAKEVFCDLDVDTYTAKLRQLAQELKEYNQKYVDNPNDPDQLIRALNTYLYFHKNFRYTKLGDANDVVSLNREPTNLFLNGILDRMMGTCVSMPVIYIALGEEMGYPIKGVNAEDHFFCRWEGNGYVSNIEATNGGEEFTDEFYKKDLGVTDEQLASGAYMKTLSKRELIGNFFFARASFYSATGQAEKAIDDFQRVVACNPRDVDGFANLAQLCARRARQLGKRVDLVNHFPDVFVSPSPNVPGARIPMFGAESGRAQTQGVPKPNVTARPPILNPQDLVPDPLKSMPGGRRP